MKTKLSVNDLVQIVECALELVPGSVSADTTHEELEEWDSLGQLNILTLLDQTLDGEAASIGTLAESLSVAEIAHVLGDHDLLA